MSQLLSLFSHPKLIFVRLKTYVYVQLFGIQILILVPFIERLWTIELSLSSCPDYFTVFVWACVQVLCSVYLCLLLRQYSLDSCSFMTSIDILQYGSFAFILPLQNGFDILVYLLFILIQNPLMGTVKELVRIEDCGLIVTELFFGGFFDFFYIDRYRRLCFLELMDFFLPNLYTLNFLFLPYCNNQNF